MAEERNLGVARAPEADEENTKAELQRRMEEARESITQTVTEIKDTVAQQYNSVKESVTDALDWREQFRRRPVAWTVGALGVGLVVGYSLGGALGGDDEDEDARYPSYEETDAFARTGASTDQNVFAPQALAGGAYGSSEYAVRSTPPTQAAAPEQTIAPRPSYSSGYDAAPATTTEEEENKPGLIDRFKETRAYDRLQEEVSDLGNRFMDELSNAARTVVLPALFNKIKELVGVDLSNKQPQRLDSGGGGAAGAGSGARLAYSAQPAGGESTSTSTSTPSTQGSSQPSQSNQQAATPSAGSGDMAQAASAGASQSRGGRLDRFNDDRTTPGGGGRESGNLNEATGYDDRYERESQLYARSENRGFGSQSRGGESGTGSTPNSTAEGAERGNG
ncbi:MAG: hypothetical protein JO360_09525 [Acidobacteria bacterium]|nr:hypothetical protein [Acidobacteriota bacterium]